jgi:serine protease Do
MESDYLKKTFFLFVVLFFLTMGACETRAAETGRLYPVTLLEMQRILTHWLNESGYRVVQSTGPDDTIVLNGIRGNERCHMILQACSPLYSSLEAECSAQGRPSPRRMMELTAFLDDYSAKRAEQKSEDRKPIPPVLSGVDAVVCISALSDGVKMFFSGFVVDPKGIVLSTAHDLDSVKEMTVTTTQGKKFRGRLIKKDERRDLAMISLESPVPFYVDLERGRSILKEGEPVFAVSCQTGGKDIRKGVVVGPVKAQKDLFLWRVEMDTPKGSSGSPVFDREGKIVAVVKGRYRGSPSTGFMIPLETVVKFLTEGHSGK